MAVRYMLLDKQVAEEDCQMFPEYETCDVLMFSTQWHACHLYMVNRMYLHCVSKMGHTHCAA